MLRRRQLGPISSRYCCGGSSFVSPKVKVAKVFSGATLIAVLLLLSCQTWPKDAEELYRIRLVTGRLPEDSISITLSEIYLNRNWKYMLAYCLPSLLRSLYRIFSNRYLHLSD